MSSATYRILNLRSYWGVLGNEVQAGVDYTLFGKGAQFATQRGRLDVVMDDSSSCLVTVDLDAAPHSAPAFVGSAFMPAGPVSLDDSEAGLTRTSLALPRDGEYHIEVTEVDRDDDLHAFRVSFYSAAT